MQLHTCMTKGRGYWEVGRHLMFVGVTMSHVSVTVCFRMGCVLSICCRLSTLCMTEFGYAPIPSRRVGNSPPSEIPVPIIYLHPNKFIRRTKTQRCATAHPTETIPTIPHDISWMIVLPWLLLLNGFFHGVVIVTWNLFFGKCDTPLGGGGFSPEQDVPCQMSFVLQHLGGALFGGRALRLQDHLPFPRRALLSRRRRLQPRKKKLTRTLMYNFSQRI